MESHGDFYLPPCSKEKCNIFLHEMAQAIRRLNSKLILVTQDPPNNSIEQSFRKSYLDCAFTILHKCRHFWKGIQPLERYILKDSSRVMCVAFRKDTRPPYEQTERHHAFFKFLHIHDASTASSLESFLNLAFESLYKKYPDRKDPGDEKDKQKVKDADEDRDRPERFVQWPDLFDSSNPTDVNVLSSFFHLDESSSVLCCSNIALLAQETKDMPLPKLKCFFLKVLPKMYSDGDLECLAFLSVCDHHQLASAAVFLLQLLLFKEKSLKPSQRINELLVAEGLLWGKLFTLRQSVGCSGFESSTLFSRLAVTYAMVLCDFVLLCIKENKQFKADTHLDTIDGRSLPPIQVQDEAIINVCKWVDSFVKDMVKRKSRSYKEMLQNLEVEREELSGPEEVKCVDQQPPAVQTFVAYQAVKEIFQSMSEDHLQFLKHYMSGREDVSNATSEIVWQGLAIFIVCQLKKEAEEDVESFCSTAMGVLECKLLPQNTIIRKGMKVDPLLQMLFFNPNPSVRSAAVMSTKVKVKDGEKQLFSMNKESLILNEVYRLLYPLLPEMEKLDNQTKQSGKDWLIYRGKFGDFEARIHLHLPLVQVLQAKLKTTFVNDDVFYHEMVMLGKLQHENIIKMFAFQLRCIPQFYVLEHHRDLQTALKNKFKSQRFFDKSDLVGYLVQALKAVEFCHFNSIVHRNLTAKSLLMVDDKTVKLSGFHLCLEMADGEAKGTVFTNNMIPTRWSAPESIKNNTFSVASDVWMFGHLMYEVLTHGNLPYSDEEEGSELANKIMKGEIHLCEHRLIQRAHYDIITRCTKLSEQLRPDLTTIKRALEQREEDAMDLFQRGKVDSDDFEDGHKASTYHGKGIPANANPVYREDVANASRVLSAPMVSDTVTKITEEHLYIFREKLGNMPSKVRVKLGKGALHHMLPYISIKESPKEMPHAECIIQRLSNTSPAVGVLLNNQPTNMCIEESLEKVALDKLLGESVKPYLDCLYHVAVLLEKLHSESWVIGDISMPLLHVQRKSQDGTLNVYLVSVGSLQKYDPSTHNVEFSDIDASEKQSRDPLMVSRAAPEVAEFGMFSLGSDIYCFGNLMWQTLEAVDCPVDMKTTYRKEQMENANFKHGKISEKWETTHAQPNNCPNDLYDLMRECTHHNSSTRISAHQLTQEMRRIIHRM